MKIFFHILAVPAGLALLSRSAWAQEVRLPAPVLQWSFYLLLIFAACVILFVFFKTSNTRKSAPLSRMLSERCRPINFVHPDATVAESVRRMHSENIGALLVMEGDDLTGIFTERDALTKVLAAGIDPNSTKVSAVMTKDPVHIDPSTTIEEAMRIVTNRRVRHLPVLDHGKLVGIVSSGDLTHWLVQDREGEIRELVDVAAHTRPR
jgi:signal-transduction protein with cAMP-binding, CBS, and nucleotidyltransferase domain